MPAAAEPRYVPATRWRVFTRLYDPVLALAMRERGFRSLMRKRVSADLPEGGVAVDVGCGTGTFAIGLVAEREDAKTIAFDGDPEILAMARDKPGAGAVEWAEGLAQEIPLADASADVVTMSLVLHHLLPEDKRRALAEAKRIVKPGGHLHIADFGRPRDPLTGALFFVSQAIDGFDRTADHRAGRLPQFITEAGFGPVERYGCFRTAAGSLDLFTARADS